MCHHVHLQTSSPAGLTLGTRIAARQGPTSRPAPAFGPPASASDSGRNPDDIECSVTVGGDLPETDADSDSDSDSEAWVERLQHLRSLGANYFIMDFGHPLNVEPALRFAEQVIAPIRAG